MKKANNAKEFLNNLDIGCDDFLQLHARLVRADKLGLDTRCGLLYLTDCNRYLIADDHHVRAINYYGAFEYVDKTCITKVGEYTFYCADDDRVSDCVDHYLQETEQSE
jgi:hypothetical protein